MIYISICCKLLNHSECRLFVDYARRFPFIFFRNLYVTKNEYEALLFARSKSQLHFVRADRRPAACNGVGSLTSGNNLRLMKTVVQTYEGFAICIESVNFTVNGVEGIVVSAFAIFCFVINNGILYFNLTCAEVTLEVRHIVLGIPETEFSKGEKRHCFVRTACIFNS
ncbi:hypothetical protein D3C80_979760 [compost metagenome]